MTRGYFITGTDTDCGKTEITLALMQLLQSQGLQVIGMKPVAAGARPTGDGLRNSDAVRIQQQGSVRLEYAEINPYLFVPPVAPHIAAAQAGIEIDLSRIAQQAAYLEERADRLLVEGVGGWQVPLAGNATVCDLALHLNLPVILVVGLKLGCINHALLTVESIESSGIQLAGWVANTIDPAMSELQQNIDTLRQLIAVPMLGHVPYLSPLTPAAVASHLQLG